MTDQHWRHKDKWTAEDHDRARLDSGDWIVKWQADQRAKYPWWGRCRDEPLPSLADALRAIGEEFKR